jgi:hypothetical protein
MTIDRTGKLEEIFSTLRELAEKDLRIGQIFSIINDSSVHNSGTNLFYIENEDLLKKLEEINKKI